MDWSQQIAIEAGKLITRHEIYARQLADEYRRRARRTTEHVAPLVPLRPLYWDDAPGFHPYLVRARAIRIGHSLSRKVREGTYLPFNPIQYEVQKLGGGRRGVSVFQIPDSMVSKSIFRSLMLKNRPLLSARAYAYRDDLSVHDALQFVAGDLRGQARVFLAEYDFSAYFDNIDHEHIRRTLHDRRFLVSPTESRLIDGFLGCSASSVGKYVATGRPPRRRGIPQGTSLSLFLANIAAWDLDRALERMGVSFARYADDTIIWTQDYSQICRAADTIHEMAARIGAPINAKKSKGINVLTSGPAELNRTLCLDFLSHKISSHCVSIKDSVVDRLKARVNKLLYFHLLRAPMRRTQDATRLTTIDRDYVTFIWQLRRHLYGGMSEARLRRFQRRGPPATRFRGFMSFFPLVDDEDQLKAVDHWIRAQVHLALRKRTALLKASGLAVLPLPHGLSSGDLRDLFHQSGTTGGKVDLRLPSVLRIGRVLRSAARRHGVGKVVRGLGFEYQRSFR